MLAKYLPGSLLALTLLMPSTCLHAIQDFQITGYVKPFKAKRGSTRGVFLSVEDKTYGYQFFDDSKKEIGAKAQISAIMAVDAISGEIKHIFSTNIGIEKAKCKHFDGKGCQYKRYFHFDDTVLNSGLYSLVLKTKKGDTLSKQYYFIVDKNDNGSIAKTEEPDFYFLLPTYTWHAYNLWGGGNLHAGKTKKFWLFQSKKPIRKVNVSDRPLVSYPSTAIYNSIEIVLPTIKYLAGKGYNFGFITSDDLEANLPPKDAKLIILLYHDEYWTYNMREHVKQYLSHGGKLLVASGNICWWKPALINGGNELVIDKTPEDKVSAIENKKFTNKIGKWHSEAIHEPGESTFGLTYRGAGVPLKRRAPTFEIAKKKFPAITKEMYERSSGIEVIAPTHDLFKNIDLKEGSLLGSNVPILDIEIDGLPVNDDGEIDYAKFPGAPRHIKPLAMGWVQFGGHLNHSVVMAEFFVEGIGRVLHLGTQGITKGIYNNNPLAKQLLANSVAYMLNTPVPKPHIEVEGNHESS